MAEYNPDDLIGRTFLLPTNQTKRVKDIDHPLDRESLKFPLD